MMTEDQRDKSLECFGFHIANCTDCGARILIKADDVVPVCEPCINRMIYRMAKNDKPDTAPALTAG